MRVTGIPTLAHALERPARDATRRGGPKSKSEGFRSGEGRSGHFAVCIYYPVKRSETFRVVARADLLLLGHFAGDFFHEFGAKTGENAFDDAGDI